MWHRIGKVIFYDVLLKKNRCRSVDICGCTEVVQTLFRAGFFAPNRCQKLDRPSWCDSRLIAMILASYAIIGSRRRPLPPQLTLAIGASLRSIADTCRTTTTSQRIHDTHAGAVFSIAHRLAERSLLFSDTATVARRNRG
jgi:hypothetical protein